MRARTLALALPLLAVGCSRQVRPPDLGTLYEELARTHDADRNPVILIPGILGSRLEQRGTGRVVWGAFTGGYADPGEKDGARLVALPMRLGAPLAELTDDVQSAGALEEVQLRIFGLPIAQQAYVYILATLGAGGFRDEALGRAGAIDYGEEHFTCFQFDYDWRRDLVENAARFDAFVADKKAYVEAELLSRYGIRREVRFNVVAHSMGGLLLRYWLRYGTADVAEALAAERVPWSGADRVDRAILVGTPNAGSVQALDDLVHGVRLSFFLPEYPPAVIGTMPSVYQLLPRERHRPVLRGDRLPEPFEGLFDPQVWERCGWGLADPEQDDVLKRLLPRAAGRAERRAIALDHQAKCLQRAADVHRALDRPAVPPPGTALHLVAGDAIDTPAVLAVDGERGAPYRWASAPGDGTVLRKSALGDERALGDTAGPLESPIAWSQVLFLFRDHLGITRDPIFTDNVLYLLLEAPRPRGRPGQADTP